jgi:hypothetical protein
MGKWGSKKIIKLTRIDHSFVTCRKKRPSHNLHEIVFQCCITSLELRALINNQNHQHRRQHCRLDSFQAYQQ